MKKLAIAAVIVLAACGTKKDASVTADTTMTSTTTTTMSSDTTRMAGDTGMMRMDSTKKVDSMMVRDTTKTK